MLKILTFDLETVGQMDSSYGQVIAYAAKWLESDDVIVKDIRDFQQYKKEPWESTELLESLADLIDEADMVVTFYGKGFDWKMVQTPLTKVDRVLPPVPHVDLYYVNRYHHKIGRGSLDAALTYFELQEQKMHMSPVIWRMAMRGNTAAMDKIKARAASDVRATEELYLKLRPLIRMHPRLASGTCKNCGGNHVSWQGKRMTAAGVTHRRFQCQECGAWGFSSGTMTPTNAEELGTTAPPNGS